MLRHVFAGIYFALASTADLYVSPFRSSLNTSAQAFGRPDRRGRAGRAVYLGSAPLAARLRHHADDLALLYRTGACLGVARKESVARTDSVMLISRRRLLRSTAAAHGPRLACVCIVASRRDLTSRPYV